MANVLVGCKLPNGLVMELTEPHPNKISLNPAPADPRKRATLKGANSVPRQGVLLTAAKDLPYGQTSVDEALASAWFKRMADSPLVRNKIVFMAKDQADFDAQALEAALDTRTRTGLEALNPGKLAKGVEADAGHLKTLTGSAA
jgi:hypothetical protein